MSVFRQIAQTPALRLSALGMMLLGVQNASIGPYVSLIAIERVGISESAFALVLTVAAVISVVSAVLFGVIGDQRGRRRGIALFSALSAVVGIALMNIAQTPLTLVLCHALLLPLGSSLYGQIFALARLASPAEGGSSDRILSTVRAGMSVTFMACLGFWTLAFGTGLDVIWTYSAALAAAAMLAVLVALNWPSAAQSALDDRPSGLSLRLSLGELAHPRVALRLLILGTINASFVIYFILVGLVFEDSRLRDASDVALYVGLVAAWEVPLLVLLPRLLAYIDRSRLIALGAGFYALHIVMMPIWVDTAWLWLGTLIAGAGGTAFIGLTIGYYQDLLQGRPGAAGSMLALQKLVADVLGAGAFALGMALGGFQTVSFIAFGLTFGGAMALALVDRRNGPAQGWLRKVNMQEVTGDERS
jgi:MFS transporter, SET family, sugar efflux transporter